MILTLIWRRAATFRISCCCADGGGCRSYEILILPLPAFLEKQKNMTNFEKKVKETGLSVYKIAKMTGVPPITLYNWANGRHMPNVFGRTYRKVAALLADRGVEIVLDDFIVDKKE